jgi:hypothetical protein
MDFPARSQIGRGFFLGTLQGAGRLQGDFKSRSIPGLLRLQSPHWRDCPQHVARYPSLSARRRACRPGPEGSWPPSPQLSAAGQPRRRSIIPEKTLRTLRSAFHISAYRKSRHSSRISRVVMPFAVYSDLLLSARWAPVSSSQLHGHLQTLRQARSPRQARGAAAKVVRAGRRGLFRWAASLSAGRRCRPPDRLL